MCMLFGALSKYLIELYEYQTKEKKFSHYVVLNESKVTEEEIARQFESLTGSEGDYSRQSDYVFYQSLNAALKNRGNAPDTDSSTSSVFTSSSGSDETIESNEVDESDETGSSEGTVTGDSPGLHMPIPPPVVPFDPGLPSDAGHANMDLYTEIFLLQLTLMESLESFRREHENQPNQQDNGPIVEEIIVSSDDSNVNGRGSIGSVD